jgi:hypothetical protein
MFGLRKIGYFVGVGLLVILLMWGWGYYSLLNRGSYDFGVNFVKANHAVNETLGEIKSSRLGFANVREHYSAGRWQSKFNIVLTGEKKSGVVFLNLESSTDGWKVIDATLKTNEGLIDIVAPVN